uniref:Glutaredoxin domain-containing protein n=1 Tax=Salix viminalis TaxID=40686 RepID=A0A6N2K0E5_SALVM
MGCSASKPNTLLAKNCHPEENLSYVSPSKDKSMFSPQFSSPTVPRALSLQIPLVHHPPSRKGDSHHLVSLTSTTYGSLVLIDPNTNTQNSFDPPQSPRKSATKIQKTQNNQDPCESLSPDSVINTWELMDGLDENDGLDFEMKDSSKPRSSLSGHSIEVVSKASSFHHLGSDKFGKKLHDSFDSLKFEKIVAEKPVSLSKPLWKHLSSDELLSKMDPNVVSSYMRALSSRQLGCHKESKDATSMNSSPMSDTLSSKKGTFLNDKDGKIVLYFTSLRGIRKTYEDCCAVRMIFRGFRVAVDERDISMDSTYRKELQSLLKGKAMILPQVFIRGNHIGGVEEIRQLNEAGELAELFEGFPVQDPRLVCEGCGDARFVPCPNCNGSRKVFDEEEEQLSRCTDCNENGLIRCPGCCS